MMIQTWPITCSRTENSPSKTKNCIHRKTTVSCSNKSNNGVQQRSDASPDTICILWSHAKLHKKQYIVIQAEWIMRKQQTLE